MLPRSLKNGTIILYDSDGDNSLTLSLETGDFSFSAIGQPVTHVPDRAGPGTLIEGPFTPITWSMSIQWTEWTAASGVSPAEVFTGVASGWDFTPFDRTNFNTNQSTSLPVPNTIQDAATLVKLFQMEMVIADPQGGTAEDLWFINCTAVIDATEGDPNTMNVSGTSWIDTATLMASIEN